MGDQIEINMDDLVISEMAPSPSNKLISSSSSNINNGITAVNLRKYGNDRKHNQHLTVDDDDEMDHIKVPSMALSLMDFSEYQLSPKTSMVQESPFFDPEFWNNDFEKRKEDRKKQLTMNLSHIDMLDYDAIKTEDVDTKDLYNGWDENEEKLMGLDTLDSPKDLFTKTKGNDFEMEVNR